VLGTLGNLDVVLVKELLESGVIPGADDLVSQGRRGASGRGRGRGKLVGRTVGGGVGVAADRRNELVAGTCLRYWYTALIEPSLQVGVRPRLVDPVTRVSGGLASLVSCLLVVGAGSREERVASARAWVGDVVVVEERLELRLSPAVFGG